MELSLELGQAYQIANLDTAGMGYDGDRIDLQRIVVSHPKEYHYEVETQLCMGGAASYSAIVNCYETLEEALDKAYRLAKRHNLKIDVVRWETDHNTVH